MSVEDDDARPFGTLPVSTLHVLEEAHAPDGAHVLAEHVRVTVAPGTVRRFTRIASSSTLRLPRKSTLAMTRFVGSGSAPAPRAPRRGSPPARASLPARARRRGEPVPGQPPTGATGPRAGGRAAAPLSRRMPGGILELSSTTPSTMRTRRMVRAASSSLCVTRSRVIPSSRLSSKKSSCISRPVLVSRLPVGSSPRSRRGSSSSARASATRCCSPPDSSPGRCCRRSFEAHARRGGARPRSAHSARVRAAWIRPGIIDVLERCELGQQVMELEDEADVLVAEVCQLARGKGGDVHPVEHDPPRGGRRPGCRRCAAGSTCRRPRRPTTATISPGRSSRSIPLSTRMRPAAELERLDHPLDPEVHPPGHARRRGGGRRRGGDWIHRGSHRSGRFTACQTEPRAAVRLVIEWVRGPALTRTAALPLARGARRAPRGTGSPGSRAAGPGPPTVRISPARMTTGSWLM